MAPKLVLTPRNSQPLTPRSAAAETAAAALVVEGFNPSIGTSSGVEYPAGAPGDFRRRRLSVTAKAVEGGSEANAEQFRRRRLSPCTRRFQRCLGRRGARLARVREEGPHRLEATTYPYHMLYV